MIAYATDFAGESVSGTGLYHTLKTIAEAGFSHIHWCHEWSGDYTYSKAEMLQIREWMEELGLRCKGVHATDGCRRRLSADLFHYRCTSQDRRDYTSENEFNRQAGVELILNRIELADVLRTDAIVLHMQLPYKSFEEEADYKERYYGQAFKSFDELREECGKRGVRICVENMAGTPEEYQIEQFDRLFSRYDSDYAGICLDTGHALIAGNDPLRIAERYQDRLYMMHIHDNHGRSSERCWEDGVLMARCDEHRNPFSGKFDWDGFARIVAGSPYELPVVIEVFQNSADREAFLRESIEAGNRFTKMVEKYRQGF